MSQFHRRRTCRPINNQHRTDSFTKNYQASSWGRRNTESSTNQQHNHYILKRTWTKSNSMSITIYIFLGVPVQFPASLSFPKIILSDFKISAVAFITKLTSRTDCDIHPHSKPFRKFFTIFHTTQRFQWSDKKWSHQTAQFQDAMAILTNKSNILNMLSIRTHLPKNDFSLG